MNSRILWFYASSYLLIKKPELPEKADNAYEFLAKRFYDGRYGGVFRSVQADGTPKDTKKQRASMRLRYNHSDISARLRQMKFDCKSG